MTKKKEVSRQRRWQIKQVEAGRCQTCGGLRKGARSTNQQCEEHADAHRALQAERYRRKVARKRK